MYRANFYGQSNIIHHSFPHSFRSTVPSYFYTNSFGDSFLPRGPGSFEQKLKQEIDALRAAENKLKNDKLTAEEDARNPHIKQQVRERSLLLEQWKNFITMFLDQAQRTMQTIASNFR